MKTGDVINLMLQFGMFIVFLLTLIVAIIDLAV
ncbi:putative holin-like toxin [Paenibacillus algorifonticola]